MNPPNHSYYGPGFTKSGRLSRNPDGKTYFKILLFMEKLVRFDIAKAQGTSLLSDRDIAKVLGKSVKRIQSYRNSTAYLKKRTELLTGIGTESAQDVEKIASLHKQQLKLMLPQALRTIYDAIQQPLVGATLAERKFRVEVARDILDREGSFPKISRTDSHVKLEHTFEDLDGVSKEVLDSIETHVQEDDPRQAQVIQDKIAVSTAFSRTETLSAQDMEASMTALEAMPVNTEIQ